MVVLGGNIQRGPLCLSLKNLRTLQINYGHEKKEFTIARNIDNKYTKGVFKSSYTLRTNFLKNVPKCKSNKTFI